MRASRARARVPALSAALLALGLALSSCAGRGELIVALDEAFVALRPGLAEALARQKAPGRTLLYLELPLAGGGSELARIIASREEPPLAVAASPLLARALLEGLERNREGPEPGAPESGAEESGRPEPGPLRGAPLLGIEWPLEPRAGLLALASDPLPAFRAAGRAMGAQVAAYRAAGETGAAGALLFSQGPGRPAEARKAFEAGFEEAAGFPPLIRDLGAALAEGGGGIARTDSGAPPSAALGAASLEGFQDRQAAAESAVRDLLASELRLLLIAAGEAGPPAARVAEGPGRAIGLAGLEARSLGKAAFLLAPDDMAAARAIIAAAILAGTTSPAPAGGAAPAPAPPAATGSLQALPYRLRALPAARNFTAGGKSLAQRLEEAANRP